MRGASTAFQASRLEPTISSAELAGFSTVLMTKVELLVGQNATIPLRMALASVEVTITVTAQSPLVDVASSQVAGNIDRRQMEELPLQGRNWMELALQVKGITANNVGDRPGVATRRSVPAQPRRPASDAEGRRVGPRAAEVQPRGDRRVPDRDQPLRRHPGAVDGDPGAGDHPRRHEQPGRQLLRLLPRRHIQRRGPGRAERAAVPEPADRRSDRRSDREGSRALLSDV